MTRLQFFSQQVIVLFVVLILSTACTLPRLGKGNDSVGGGQMPQVTLTNPIAGQKLETGQELKVVSTAIDSTSGIVRVELLVDNQVTWVDANPQPQPNEPYIVAQPWTPLIPGSHVLQARAYNTDNVAGQSEPLVVDVVVPAQAAVAEPPTPTGEIIAENTPTNTPAPLVDARAPATTLLPATNTPSPQTSTPTDTPPPTITLTPTATPTPGSFQATGLEPDGRFKDIWQKIGAGESRLGYPIGPELTDRNFARQYFERGLMYWWDNPDGSDDIWVIDSPAADLKSGATWNRYPDEWAGDEAYACDEARRNGEMGPIRGFGWLWCARPELRARLGNPRTGEAGSGGNPPFAHVQFFQGGVMLLNPLNNEVFVLFDQGDWLRFGWN
ncbi:MAG: hypothetical protein JW953_05795 [Anaerolineae bacterium]|nr:hypothetical protein [Anaerolineae bacterium]